VSYVPTSGTIAARAIEFIERRLERQPKGAWIPNTDVCAALGVPPNAIRPSLGPAIDAGLIERSLCDSGYTQWRLAYLKPRRQPVKAKPVEAPTFSIPNWPPGFVSKFDSVKVARLEERRK
jgi:hypothetical protein